MRSAGRLACAELTWLSTGGAIVRVLAILACSGGFACAQTNIRLDSSWSRTPATIAPGTTVVKGTSGQTYNLPGSVYSIAEAQGRVAGANLFHSFESFSVGAGDAAVFTTTTASLQNVISRVTGGTPSQINGLLALIPENGGKPSLFFVNPAGVTFGAGARVDVPGALHVSTADQLRFADGTQIKTGDSTDSTLSVAAPEAFGFLGSHSPAGVKVNSLDANGAPGARVSLALAPGSAFSIASGMVELDVADVSAPGGALRIAAVGTAPGEVEVPVGRAPAKPLTGTISARDAAAATDGAGTLDLDAGIIDLNEGTKLSASAGRMNIVADKVALAGGSTLRTAASGESGSGSIVINANELAVRGGSAIVSQASDTRGNVETGELVIQGLSGAGSAARSVLVSGANSELSTGTAGAASGGDIHIAAQQTSVEKLGKITVSTGGKGNAGNVTITGDTLHVSGGGRIEASTAGEGNGGSIIVSSTGDVLVTGKSDDGQTRSGVFAKTQSDTGAGSGGGTGGGGGGTGGGTGSGSAGGSSGGGVGLAKAGAAGNVTIDARRLVIDAGAQIDSSTTSGGPGGSVTITALEDISIAGSDTRLTSDASRGDGSGGTITLVARRISVLDGARITAQTGGRGNAGDVALSAAEQLLLQGGGKVTTSTSGAGKGGSIQVQAGNAVLDGPDTAIAADTLRPFADLTITIDIAHPNDEDLVVLLESPSATRVALLSRVGGDGDDFVGTRFDDQAGKAITSGAAPFTGTFRPREPLAQLIDELAAGNWTLNVRDQSAGQAGVLQSWTLRIGSQTFSSSGAPKPIPDGGTLRSVINVPDLTPALVQGTGEAKGAGGDVTVLADAVTLRNGAALSAVSRGAGPGGTVQLEVSGGLALDNARISTDTFGSGRAGNVEVSARSVRIDGRNSGILADAAQGSSGQTGSVTVSAGSSLVLSNGAILSIHNDATVDDPSRLTPTLLSVAAPAITLTDARITAEATGNAAASDISIHFTHRMIVDPSSITTSASDGNGGDIAIAGSGLLWLDHSQITTSVSGASGNGGDIAVNAGILVLETGFIQANTAARQAQGGNVAIDAGALLASGVVQVGGDLPLPFDPALSGVNVIQAAAPDGVSGAVGLTNPALDISGDLSALSAALLQPAPLARDLCRLGAGSSLATAGRGGLRPTALGFIRPELVSPASTRRTSDRALPMRQALQ